ALMHVALIGPYVKGGWKLAYWIGLALVGVAALAYARVVKPLQQTRRPYRIAEIHPEADKTWSLVVEPVKHAGFRFSAGQFAWLKVGSPWSIDEHPFSFSSSAERPERLEFGIKEAGDFTSRIGQLDHQLNVYLDGPHGAFSTDRTPAEATCFIAGGIGIVPILSMIRTLADRNDPRPLLLF